MSLPQNTSHDSTWPQATADQTVQTADANGPGHQAGADHGDGPAVQEGGLPHVLPAPSANGKAASPWANVAPPIEAPVAGEDAQAEVTAGGSDTEPPAPAVTPFMPTKPDVHLWLEGLQEGWTDAQLDQWLYQDFLSPLADIPHLSVPDLILALDQLIAALKASGYTPKKRKQYKSIWKEIALEKVEKQKAQKLAAHAGPAAAGLLPGRFRVMTKVVPGANAPQYLDPFTGERLPTAPPLSEFETECIADMKSGEYLSNFTLTIDREVEVRDEFEPRNDFVGRLKFFGKEFPFRISAADYSDNGKLRAAVTEVAGVGAVIHVKTDLFREAVSTLNWQPGLQQPARQVVTTDFGWTPDGTAFLVPGGHITADGFTPADDHQEVRVDFADEELARHLGSKPAASQEELLRVKRHLVDDLLELHDRRVTYSLLGAAGAALLCRFTPESMPFVLWLKGLTGAGKSLAAKVFMNFFGNFPPVSGHFASWGSTANYLQRQGYFFKDALYLIDDYKPDVVAHHQVVRILQNYADRTGRGRLKVDATTNTTRPIRGLLVSTAEDVPEHSASALARSIIITVPQREKDFGRYTRCLGECRNYSGVTADFVRHVLADRRTAVFARRVSSVQKYYYRGIAGQQNDGRIAANFALLAAGFFEMAFYLRDAWPGWKDAVRQFVTGDLIEVRDEMVGAVQEQDAAEVFWSVLKQLVEFKAVALDGSSHDQNRPVIGKKLYPSPDGAVVSRSDTLYCVSTDLALAEVNKSLRAQGRPELRVTPRTLLEHLCRAGYLLDDEGQPLSPGCNNATRQRRIGGGVRRVFVTSKSRLLGPDGESDPVGE